MISIFIALSLKFFYLHHTSANSVCTSVVAKESTTQIRNSIEKDGRYLEAAIIETRLVPSVLSCSQKCLYIEECRTANFHKIAATDGLHQCELLQDAPGDNASQFNVLQDWIHLQFVRFFCFEHSRIIFARAFFSAGGWSLPFGWEYVLQKRKPEQDKKASLSMEIFPKISLKGTNF